jgi:hypothetical protein
MGKLAAILLILIGTAKSPVFVYALQTKTQTAIHLLQDLTQHTQDQQDAPERSPNIESDESDDFKLPVGRLQIGQPFRKIIQHFSDAYLIAAVPQQNYTITTPPPEC